MTEYIIDYEKLPLKWRDGYGLNDVDLVERLIRCRDCEYFKGYKEDDPNCVPYCDNESNLGDVGPNDYCSGAELKKPKVKTFCRNCKHFGIDGKPGCSKFGFTAESMADGIGFCYWGERS